MDHKERMQLAQGLCDRVVEKYQDGIILGGLYGSTARGLDTRWSDLEMLFITRDGCTAQGQQFIYRGIAAGFMVMERGKLEELLSNPSLEGFCGWPFYMGVLSVMKVLYGDQSQVETWLKMGSTVPEAKFREALVRHLPGLVTESYGRILSCKERGNEDDLYCAVLEVLFEMRDALCLLNRSWVTHDYMQAQIDSFRFPILPRRYEELVPMLWRARGFDEVMPLAGELVENFWQLMSEAGLTVPDYKAVSDIPVSQSQVGG